jgi:hypothetical protein
MNTLASRIFDLPELAQIIAEHLPQGAINKCVRVSKTWHATFIPYLWRTFSEETTQSPPMFNWLQRVSGAILHQQHNPEELEWFKDVYRRHAKYIRHLTIQQPVFLDACLEDAFESTFPGILSNNNSNDGNKDDESAEASPSMVKTTTASTTIPNAITGRSLLTNLESLAISVSRHSLATYFNVTLSTGEQPATTPGLFGTGTTFAFGGPNGINTNIINNGENDNQPTTDSVETTLQRPKADPCGLFTMACQRLILCNPKLRALQCVLWPQIFLKLSESPLGYQALMSLKRLSIVTYDCRIPKFLPPNITSLAMTNAFPTDPFSPSIYNYSNSGSAVYNGLEVLDVKNVKSGSDLIALLNQAPLIKTLILNCTVASFGFGYGSSITFASTLCWPLSRVTVLKFRQSRSTLHTSESFKGIFQAFPLLTEYHDDTWNPSVAPQLTKHCPLLEVIRAREDPVLESSYSTEFHFGQIRVFRTRRLEEVPNDNVSELLSSLSKLRILDIPHGMVTADNVLEKPWVCLDLEEFRCHIVRIPFLTKEQKDRIQEMQRRENQTDDSQPLPYCRTDEEDQLMELSDRCVSTTRAIMVQLSKLTSLKHLSLCPDLKFHNEVFESRLGATLVYKSERDGRSYIRYNDVLPDTLHLRLDSGLRQLAALTKLEYLGFESMDHQMDTAEIEWIAKQFPRLKEMRGLATGNYIGIEPDPKIDALVALMRRLRPNVVQGQSFGGYTTAEFGSFGIFGAGNGNLFS